MRPETMVIGGSWPSPNGRFGPTTVNPRQCATSTAWNCEISIPRPPRRSHRFGVFVRGETHRGARALGQQGDDNGIGRGRLLARRGMDAEDEGGGTVDRGRRMRPALAGLAAMVQGRVALGDRAGRPHPPSRRSAGRRPGVGAGSSRYADSFDSRDASRHRGVPFHVATGVPFLLAISNPLEVRPVGGRRTRPSLTIAPRVDTVGTNPAHGPAGEVNPARGQSVICPVRAGAPAKDRMTGTALMRTTVLGRQQFDYDTKDKRHQETETAFARGKC